MDDSTLLNTMQEELHNQTKIIDELSKFKDDASSKLDVLISQMATMMHEFHKEKSAQPEDKSAPFPLLHPGSSSIRPGFQKPDHDFMPPKIEFPTFEGDGPREWIRKCERYFNIHKIEEDHRVGIAEIHLRGKSDLWFGCWKLSYPHLITWTLFSQEICRRFTYRVMEEVVDEFHRLNQMGNVEEYHQKFEELRFLVAQHTPGLSEEHYIASFIGGLKEEIRAMVRLFKPQSLIHALEIARAQEAMMNSNFNKPKHTKKLGAVIEGGGFMAKDPRPSTLTVYLYAPNIIGYIRILLNCIAFAVCFQDKRLFSTLYFVSFLCDALDGWVASKLNQVSTIGAILDMLIDRISTACLLVILSQVYRPGLIFLSLLALDISSHWLQMYSAFLVGKTSHKDVKESTNWLLRAYYGNQIFLGYCCASCEVLYISLFLFSENGTENLPVVLATSAKNSLLSATVLALSFCGCVIKQLVNGIQVSKKCRVIVSF